MLGGSAGGTLAGLAAADPALRVRAVAFWSAPTELATLVPGPDGVPPACGDNTQCLEFWRNPWVTNMFGCTPEVMPRRTTKTLRSSITPPSLPPTFISNATQEIVPLEQAQRLESAVRAAGTTTDYHDHRRRAPRADLHRVGVERHDAVPREGSRRAGTRRDRLRPVTVPLRLDDRRDRRGRRRYRRGDRRSDRERSASGARPMSPVRIDTWAEWIDEQSTRIRSAGQWREIRSLDGQPEGVLTATGQAVVSFAVQRLPGTVRASGGESRGDRGRRTLGNRCGRVASGRRLASGARRARGPRWHGGAAPRLLWSSRPAMPPTPACSPCSAVRACASVPTSSTTRR